MKPLESNNELFDTQNHLALTTKSKFWNRNKIWYKIRDFLLLRNVDYSELSEISFKTYNTVSEVPELFTITNAQIFSKVNIPEEPLARAIQIMKWLRENIVGGPGLGLSSTDTLFFMLNGKFGVCSDFSHVFSIFCLLNEVKVREWGVKGPGVGHSFNEIYCSNRKKWLFVDVSKGILFKNENDDFLSVIEVFEKSNVKIIVPMTNFSFDYKSIVKTYFSKECLCLMLIDNYNITIYDRILKWKWLLPLPVLHGFAILLGKSYRFLSISNCSNRVKRPLFFFD